MGAEKVEEFFLGLKKVNAEAREVKMFSLFSPVVLATNKLQGPHRLPSVYIYYRVVVSLVRTSRQ